MTLAGTAAGQRRELRHDAAAYMPTAEGTAWTYRRTTVRADVPGAPGLAMVTRGVLGTYRQPDGRRWHLIALQEGGSKPTFEHWNTEGPGLLVERSTSSTEVRGATACWIAAPVGAVTQWQWEAPNRKNTVEHRATIVAVEDPVTVPAGTFRCVHVHIAELGGEEEATEHLWFARQTGLVRSSRVAGDETVTTELLRVSPGRDQTADRSATLEVLAPPDWLWGPRGRAAVHWFEQGPGSVQFGGRFAIVDNGARRQAAYVRVGTFVPIPEGPLDTTAILGAGQRPPFQEVLWPLARLHAQRLGLWEVELEPHLDTQPYSIDLHGTDASGRRTFVCNEDGQRFPWVAIHEVGKHTK